MEIGKLSNIDIEENKGDRSFKVNFHVEIIENDNNRWIVKKWTLL